MCAIRTAPSAAWTQASEVSSAATPQGKTPGAELAPAHHSMMPPPTTSTVAAGRPPARLAATASCVVCSSRVAALAPLRPRTTKRVCPAPSLQQRR